MARRITGREWGLLAVMVAAGLFALVYGRNPRIAGGGDDDQLGELRIVEVPVVQMAFLEQGGAPYDEDGRSLFKYYVPPPPPRAKAPPRPKPPPPKPPPPPPQPKREKPVRSKGPTPPSPGFVYIGYLGPKDNKIAFFEDEKGIFQAQLGDVVREHFRIQEFKYEGVVMSFTDERFEGRTTQLDQLGIEKKGR